MRHSPALSLVILTVLVATTALPAAAAPVLPASALNGDLATRMARHGRQFWTFNARPFGLSLDVYAKDAAARTDIENFLKQEAVPDFQTFSGKHPYDVIADFGEHGDLGFFGGIALASAAYEYRVLKRDGGTPQALASARARVVRAAESWHVFYAVTGGNGIVARGIRRVGPDDLNEAGAPPIPGAPQTFVPLQDDQGPLPRPKDNGCERADNSAGVLPPGTWTWIDSASKDQLVGQMFGMVALYDAMAGDPDVDQALVQRMRDDVRGVFQVLKVRREILGLEGLSGEGLYDLIIMDADGRPTMYHDLNPFSMEKIYMPEGSKAFNVFNLFMAYAILSSIHHVTGDDEVQDYLYRELLGDRGFLAMMQAYDGPDAVSYLYMGLNTNTDVPDMTGVALFLGLYLETDDAVRAPLRRYLEDGWWAPTGVTMAASNSRQALWHSLYLAATDKTDRQAVADDLAQSLAAYPAGDPLSGGYWDDSRINCDDTEIAAGSCLAIDGTTVITIAGRDRNGKVLATQSLDPSIRPNSNFNARSNPFEVNGGGSARMLNPGGDLLASYWMGRYFDLGLGGNRSPNARTHMPVGGNPEPMPDSAQPADDEGPTDLAVAEEVLTGDLPTADVPIVADTGADITSGGTGDGCTAGAVPGAAAAFPLVLAFLGLALRRRRA